MELYGYEGSFKAVRLLLGSCFTVSRSRRLTGLRDGAP